MSDQTISFAKQIASCSPSLELLLKEHVKDNDEVLPHVFFGDIVRHVVSLILTARKDGPSSSSELTNILDSLEKAYSLGNGEIQELVSVSFLENLPRPGEEGAEIRGIVGPHLKKQLRLIG